MTEAIRTWPDALFYLSSAGTANVREQLIKLQQSTKRIRALSDAATVNTNGDVLQDILTGLSLGNSTQRHKYRVLYDTLNDRFLVQRNSGTDASKVWVELLRLDASGNLTVTGNFSQDLIETDTGEVVLGSTLNLNDFYVRNVDKYVGEFRTDALLVHGPAQLKGANTLSGTTSVTGTVNFPTAAGLTVGSNSARVAAYTYAENAGNQAVTGLANTNITSLTALDLPNTSATLTSRSFLVQFAVSVLDTSGSTNTIVIELYNGANGTNADTRVYGAPSIIPANTQVVISGMKRFSPGAADRTKFGLSLISGGNCTISGGGGNLATVTAEEVA